MNHPVRQLLKPWTTNIPYTSIHLRQGNVTLQKIASETIAQVESALINDLSIRNNNNKQKAIFEGNFIRHFGRIKCSESQQIIVEFWILFCFILRFTREFW